MPDPIKTTWKKWRVGLWLAIAIALLSAVGGIASDMTWRQIIASVSMAVSAGIVNYIVQSPIQNIEDKDP